jgi:DNA-binding MarR family transcriptional regulator
MSAGKIQKELKKKRPFDSLEQEAAITLLRTSDQIQIRFTRLLREHGLTSSQYNILRILRGEGKPLPCLEVADRMIVVVPAITGLIDRLEHMELVTRERSVDDRRVVFVSITALGVRLLAKLDQPVLDLHEAILGHLSQPELRELIRLLDKARDRNCVERE